MHYIIGTTVQLIATFSAAVAGTLNDPTSVVLKIQPPTGGLVTYTYGVSAQLIRVETGVYSANVDLTIAGTWTWRWEGLGTVDSIEEGTLVVDASALP